MQIHLTDILSCEGKTMEWTGPVEMDTFVSPMGAFPIIKKSPCRLTVISLGQNRVQLEGAVDVTVLIPCDRCLTDVETKLSLSIEKEVKVQSEEENGIEEPVETEFIFGYNLDVDELVRNEILVNWPMKTLCRETCKGICQKCGRNLNHGPCGCDTVESDPRMAAIRDIFALSKVEHYK